MVFFSCDGCGEMLKKNQVDAHANRCRNCHAVSCVDCSVSFWGDEYRAHTSCITEAERYEKKAPSSKSKKRNPQQEWMDIVNHCAGNAPQSLKSYMDTMAGLDNIPRKEKQFINFTSNSLNLRGNHGKGIVQEIWKLLKSEREKRTAEREQEQQQEQEKQKTLKEEKESSSSAIKTRKSEKKSAPDASADHKQTAEKVSSSNGKLDTKKVHKAMKKTLIKAPKHTMKLKALHKLLLKELGLPKSSKKELKMVVLSHKKVKVDGKTVTLNVE